MTRAIVVMTIGRSGSSALAGALHQAGIPFYDTKNDHIGRNRELNPKGHFEMKSWFPHGLRLAGCVNGTDNGRDGHIEALRGLIKRRTANNPVIWGVKSTTLPWTLPTLMPYFPDDTRVIVSMRGFDALAQSLKRHNGVLNEMQAADLVRKRLDVMDATIAGLTCPVHDVRFEQMMLYPERVLRGALEFCLDGIKRDYDLRAAVEWIEPELVHFG